MTGKGEVRVEGSARDARRQMTDHTELAADLTAQIAAAPDLEALDQIRVAALGKTGVISGLLRSLGQMSPDQRRVEGPAINGLRDTISAAIVARKAQLEDAALEAELAAGRLDLSLPAPPRRRGSVHPTLQVMDEMVAVFAEMGFSVAEGPDIEDDFHNFSALNFPPRHPAREMHDTFFLKPDANGERKLLRTHTSPIQVRVMRRANTPAGAPQYAVHQAPPIRIIGPGRVYRCDSDATHSPMFHQMEGLVIDRAIHMGHLKWTLDAFVRRFFEIDNVDHPLPSAPLPLHRALGGDGRAVRPLRRHGEDRRGQRLAGDTRRRHGAPQHPAHLRPRSGRVAGLRLRPWRRPAGDAEVRHARRARHDRRRHPLAGALRVLGVCGSEPGVGAELMKALPTSLLPLREKVAAKRSDEGSRRLIRSTPRRSITSACVTPHPSPAATPSPARGEGRNIQ
jgi:phenylalanyl-tRNA synthetase alpha subunit